MTVNFTKNLDKVMERLYKKGAFLTARSGEKINTMTISWGNIGFEWKKPIFTVLVRKSRYTHEFIENSKEFTVSIPMDDKMESALMFCGTKSGRNVDKISQSGLKLEQGEIVKVPVIGNCGYIYECRVVYKQDMDLDLVDGNIMKSTYPDDDKHTIYYGEIVACYTNK